MPDNNMSEMPPDVAANFKDNDPTKAHEWQSANMDELLSADSPSWSGPALPGAFPDYQSETRDDFLFPPVELMPDQVGNPPVYDGFEGRPFVDAFTKHPGLWENVGRPTRAYTFADIANSLTASQTVSRMLMQGPGVLYGVTAFSVATAVTPFTALTDSLDGNGPVLMLFANNTVLSGFISAGLNGIEFKNGLTLTNLTTAPGVPGAQLAVVPIIRRRHVVNHKPTGE